MGYFPKCSFSFVVLSHTLIYFSENCQNTNYTYKLIAQILKNKTKKNAYEANITNGKNLLFMNNKHFDHRSS